MPFLPKWFPKGGLFVRIIILVSLLLTFIVSINTILAIRRETTILTKGMIEKNKLRVMYLSNSAKTAFMSLDWYSVQNFVSTSTASGEVVYCRVVKPDGEIFIADDQKLYGKKIDQILPSDLKDLLVTDAILPKTGEKIKLIINPISIGKDRWSVWLAVSLKPIHQIQMRIIYRNLVEGVLIILMGALITSWLSKSITHPLELLVEGTRQVSGGNLAYQIKVARQDEIGKLAAAFNQMTSELAKNRDEINAYSKTLEDKVAERTQKLRHEIMERKAVEENRKRLETQLQRAHKMEAIGTLAGGVAHDLNNILSGLVNYPELILMDLPQESPFYELVVAIKKSGEKAATIVQDLLTLARRGVNVKEVINLNQVIDNFLNSPEFEKTLLNHAGLQIETHFDQNLLNISGSPVHLSKTLMNLIINAAEAITGSGTIRITTANHYIDQPVGAYTQVKEGDYAVITVADTGIGIAPKDKERIFEPFYTKKVMGKSGSGLGMAVVWGTVKDHSGYIDVQSTPGQGTTFTLYFPVTREVLAEKTDPRSSMLAQYRGHGERILVIDDMPEQRQIASEILARLDYSVTTAESGEEAVAYLQNNSADLLILDMIMSPGIDGAETYKQILKCHPGQKAIIVSGFSESSRVKEAQALGAGAYVKKPYIFASLGQAVKDQLRL